MSPDIQQSMDRFSVELYQKLLAGAGTDSSKNLFFSPLSVSAALMLAYAGAKGTTKTRSAKHWTSKTLRIRTFSIISSKVLSIFTVPKEASYNFTLSNRAYVQHHASAVVKEINQWVEKQTNGKIQNLIPESGVSASTLMVLVNAVYFKARWDKVFVKEGTMEEDFTMLDGTTSKVDMMRAHDERY